MKQLLLLTVTLLSTVSLIAQSTFYIQNGNSISKVENRNPEQVKAKEWQVKLYRKGAPKSGNSNWGVIKGSTAKEVMAKLKRDQEFELRFNAFIDKGRVQDDVLTNFNPLGPIAIIEESPEEESFPKESLTQVAELYEKTKDYMDTYREVKKKLDVILKGKPMKYQSVLKEYIANLKGAFKQVYTLRNMLKKNTDDLIEKINENMESITAKLDAASANQQQLTELIDDNNLSQENTGVVGSNASGSKTVLLSNVPSKFQNSVSTVINAGSEITAFKNSVPDDLTNGMNAQQKAHFQNFVNHIYSYTSSMSSCFWLMSEGSKGYGYLNNNKTVIDVADQYYRDNVLQNEDILKTDNYNSYYSNALLEKANAAYELFKVVENDPTVSKQVKNNLLNYGIANLNMIYQQSIPGYQDQSILKDKQELISKLKQNLK